MGYTYHIEEECCEENECIPTIPFFAHKGSFKASGTKYWAGWDTTCIYLFDLQGGTYAKEEGGVWCNWLMLAGFGFVFANPPIMIGRIVMSCL